MRAVLAYTTIAFIGLAAVLHLLGHLHAAELCGNVAFFSLVAAVFAPSPKPAEPLAPDSTRDQALYDALYADVSSNRSFESRSKVDLFAVLIQRTGIDLGSVSACDVGFGDGLILEYMLEHGAGKLAGVELSSTAVTMLHRRYTNMDLRSESAERTSFKTGEFDLVVCSNVLEHVETHGAILSEISRITRPGGQIIVGVPGTDSPPDPRHFRVYSKITLEDALRSKGMPPIGTIVAGSRLVRALTPSLTLATPEDLDSHRTPILLGFLRQLYHAAGVPILRRLYVASVRTEDRGFVNEVWTAARR